MHAIRMFYNEGYYRLAFRVMRKDGGEMVSVVVLVVNVVREYENIALSAAFASRHRAAN